jgi:SH3-like domain-containing protein
MYATGRAMGASHFFVGLGAGIAILTVPVVTLGGLDVPNRLAAWIEGPPAQPVRTGGGAASISRPTHGYKPGDPTPAADSPPTVQPALRPTPAAPVQPAAVQPPPSGSMRTGVIRAGGGPVYVRRAAGVESPDDPQIADGAPVLVSAGGSLQIGGQPWRAVRGLSGIVGWVPGGQVVVDGEGAPLMVGASSATTPGAAAGNAHALPTMGVADPGPAGAPGERLRVVNTDGVGVVLRNSPRDADKTTRGLMDGANVSVLERNGNEWVHVHADNGQDGWIPTRYVAPAL